MSTPNAPLTSLKRRPEPDESNHIFISSIKLSSRLGLIIQTIFCISDFVTKMLCISLVSHTRATFSAHHMFTDLQFKPFPKLLFPRGNGVGQAMQSPEPRDLGAKASGHADDYEFLHAKYGNDRTIITEVSSSSQSARLCDKLRARKATTSGLLMALRRRCLNFTVNGRECDIPLKTAPLLPV